MLRAKVGVPATPLRRISPAAARSGESQTASRCSMGRSFATSGAHKGKAGGPGGAGRRDWLVACLVWIALLAGDRVMKLLARPPAIASRIMGPLLSRRS